MTKLTPAFKTAYQALNKEQKTAVDTIDGPVMVVAGPGTGKTQTIALRIANIIARTDADPSSILALTFTDSGARAMRERLVSMIGAPAYSVAISTFHSFCSLVIQEYQDYFTLDPSAEPISELESYKLIHRLLDTLPVKVVKPAGAPYHYARELISSISTLKREGVDLDEFANILDAEEGYLNSDEAQDLKKTERVKRERDLVKNRDLLLIYRDYQRELASTHRFDYDDMISSVTQALQDNPELLLELQERYQYLLIDEYQDTNNSQNELALLLVSYWGEQGNIFVVGDPDQCIYRFSGASIENQLSFIKYYPQAKLITLQKNYRSTQHILDAADSTISHNNLRINDVVSGIDPHLQSVKGEGAPIRVAELSSHTAELVFLATDIKRLIDSGTSASEIAVIYRTNREAAALKDILTRHSIDYSTTASTDALANPTITNFLKILRVIDEMSRSQEDEDLFTILHYEIFGIEPLDILKLARLAGTKRLSLFDILASSKQLDSLNLINQDKLVSAFSLLTKFAKLDAEHTFPEFFELVLNETGYLNWLLKQPDSNHRVALLNTLFSQAKSLSVSNRKLNLASFLTNIDLMLENKLKLAESSYGKNKDAITLTTAHSAKGLEWDHVYLTHLTYGKWGNTRTRKLIKLPDSILTNTDLTLKDKNEEERCLFYVALTRGRLSVTLSYAKEYSSLGSKTSAIASLFLAELGDKNMEEIDTTAVESEAAKHLERLLTVPTHSQISSQEQEFLEGIVQDYALSPTALNSYLKCPYKFKLDNLLRIPHSKKPHLAFGTAVHFALESFYRTLKDTGNPPTRDSLLTSFKAALAREIMTQQDHDLRLAQGVDILGAYYDFFAPDYKEPLYLEKKFRVLLGDITLTGKVDRIETLNPSLYTIKVIDYKTGKAKTKNYIEGKTKAADLDLKRQLTFYRLLIDLDNRIGRLKFGVGELDFVANPHDKGKSGRLSLEITDEEVEELKGTIKDVMTEIRALHFPRTTDYKHCGNCDFRDHCYPSGIPRG